MRLLVYVSVIVSFVSASGCCRVFSCPEEVAAIESAGIESYACPDTKSDAWRTLVDPDAVAAEMMRGSGYREVGATYVWDDARVVRYKNYDLDYGSGVPDAVVTPSTRSGTTLSFVLPHTWTQAVESPETDTMFLLKWSWLGLLVLAALFLAIACLGALTGELRARRSMLLALLGVLCFTGAGFAGFERGSRLTIDNALDREVIITVDDGHPLTLPAKRHVVTRLRGAGVEIRAETAAGRLETLLVDPDESIWHRIERSYLGGDDYIYNICGKNGYKKELAGYGSMMP